MQGYRYFYIGGVIITSQSGNIYPYLLLDGTEDGKSYRIFTEWLIEAHYLRMFLKITRIPHFTILQKFADRISNSILERTISSFIALILINVNHIFFGIDSSGFKSTHSSHAERTRLFCWNVLKHIICSIKVRRDPTR